MYVKIFRRVLCFGANQLSIQGKTLPCPFQQLVINITDNHRGLQPPFF